MPGGHAVEELKVCTISKYPPYMSGHSFEAMYQGRALFEMTYDKHYEVTYDQSVYDQAVNYNNSPELMSEAEAYTEVHRILPDMTNNAKVLDGALIKAFTGRVIDLVVDKGVNVISTFYLDPHAYIANQAKLYAKLVHGKDVIVVNKTVGSDVLNSIANHLNDGEARFLLLQLLVGDIMLAVSEYTREKVIEYAQDVLPTRLADDIEARLQVLYAPIDADYFRVRDEAEIALFRKKYKLPDDKPIISYFGRLFPEKGVEDLLAAFPLVKRRHPDTVLVIGGCGISSESLMLIVQREQLPDVIFTGAVSNAEKRALMQESCVGIIPTKPVLNFVETLCICALEYQAAGTPLITTRVGGVPEAAGPHSSYVTHSSPRDLATAINRLLAHPATREHMVEAGQRFVQKFHYYEITKTFLDLVDACRSADRR